jgi:uncharacterized membrane protein YcjF (UPF0283 family)
VFSRFVLAPADQLAQAAIRRAAAQAFAIARSVRPCCSTRFFFAARAMLLIREIAEIYGQHPGFAGTVHLLRGAGLVGAVDIVIAQQFGGVVQECLSAAAAESAYAATKNGTPQPARDGAMSTDRVPHR